MPNSQRGIIPAPSSNALFLIFRIREAAVSGKTVAKIASGIPSLVDKVGSLALRAKLV
jgi:hypothetical protein